jgi:Arc/MetJ-type ribon-helix-helix transcriptional regulator
MSKVKRTTVTLPAGLYERAEAAMHAQDFTTFSDYIQYLIREDARLHGAYAIQEQHANYGDKPQPPAAKPLSSPQPQKTDTADKVLGLVKESYPGARKKHARHPKAPK